MPNLIIADAVVIVHFLIVLFIVAGVPLVYLGVAAHWAWVRSWPWRALHLAAISLVAAESLFGISCPLTVWENALRGMATSRGFIERWMDRVIFYDAPTWVFTVAYLAFAALVLATWVAVPPTRRWRAPPED
ncbi:MAG TPA: DUF2784 domain-containing protein [Steroidobacteraceae bacterium]|nr:DUF2784 domain-containing protein [Steroidobacteraceae bacterium]